MKLKTMVLEIIDYLIITMFVLSQIVLLVFAINFFTEILGKNFRIAGEIIGTLAFLSGNLLVLFLTKTNLLLEKK